MRLRRPALHRMRVAFAGDGRNRAARSADVYAARRPAALTHDRNARFTQRDTVRTQRGNREAESVLHSAFAAFEEDA